MYCKVTYLVKDEDVGRALRSVAGIAFDVEALPVVNLRRTNDGRSVAETAGTLPEMFAAHLQRAKPERVTRSYAREWLVSIGRRSSMSASHVIKKAYAAGLLKKHGSGTSVWYSVNARSTS